MEYNVNNSNKLSVGDTLVDEKNTYVVKDTAHRNTHSQYASEVLVECLRGPHKGRSMWVGHHLATKYKKAS